jgi:tRNA A-37 threonylcarbamoyl transferase component Bud32
MRASGFPLVGDETLDTVDGDTLVRLDATVLDRPIDAGNAGAPLEADSRYAMRSVLGAGGMGEVRLCEDQLIGREVAVKVIHAARREDARAVSRFIREARIQGQLEHPSIVPVHDLGRTPDGGVFFTMKRVRGKTLATILAGQKAGDRELSDQYSDRKLLTAFVTVCLAVELAHRRGVLHRDLKPANIMLGDFGEVYVLDWGIARLAGAGAESSDRVVMPADSSAMTRAGELIGTPGYMSPEQAGGAELDARSDVYALGAILFECLTHRPLHEGERVVEVLTSTLHGVNARPSVRAPDRMIAPELEAICVRATALDPRERFSSARELASAVERFLDGRRDSERRRQLADEHAERARRLAAQAFDRSGTLDDRSVALAEVGRALGLDPQHPQARRTMVELLTTPPAELPAEAKSALDESVARTQRMAGAIGILAYTLWLLATPLAWWMGIVRPELLVAFVAAHVFALASSFWMSRLAQRPRPLVTLVATAGPLLAAFTTHFMFGSLVLLPTLLCAVMSAMLLNPRPLSRSAIVVTVCVMIAAPSVLGALGVTEPSYAFDDGVMSVQPVMLQLPEVPTTLSLILASLLTVGTLALSITRIRDDLSRAERRLQLQAWQLRQLVSSSAGPHVPDR